MASPSDARTELGLALNQYLTREVWEQMLQRMVEESVKRKKQPCEFCHAMMTVEQLDPKAFISSATALLDQAFGSPVETRRVEITVPRTFQELDALSSDELRELALAIERGEVVGEITA